MIYKIIKFSIYRHSYPVKVFKMTKWGTFIVKSLCCNAKRGKVGSGLCKSVSGF